jgi:signal transduction histidine kinase
LNLLAEQWSCQIETSFNPPDLVIPKWLAHEITQFTSEAVANAVRHGRATRLRISVVAADHALVLEFIDNGTGIADQAKLQQPSSLSARVARLGGNLTLCRTSPGLGVHIELPLALEAH